MFKLILSFLFLSLFSSEVLAEKEDVEKIKVTGSRVKRIDFEGPSPITVITEGRTLRIQGISLLDGYFIEIQAYLIMASHSDAFVHRSSDLDS